MDRRTFLAAGTSTLVALAGCGADDETSQSADPTEGSSQDPSQEPDTVSDTSTSSGGGEGVDKVEISYKGDWSGTVGSEDSTQSVDGSGTETFDVEGDPLIVTANGQKQDGGGGELTVSIIQNNKAIAEESTSAEYGVAQVTSEDDASSGGDSGSSGSFEVRVEYNGEWQGSFGGDGSRRTVEGSGTGTVAIDGEPNVVSANAQKQDDSGNELTIQILQDGEVVKEASTSAEYGVAQVSY